MSTRQVIVIYLERNESTLGASIHETTLNATILLDLVQLCRLDNYAVLRLCGFAFTQTADLRLRRFDITQVLYYADLRLRRFYITQVRYYADWIYRRFYITQILYYADLRLRKTGRKFPPNINRIISSTGDVLTLARVAQGYLRAFSRNCRFCRITQSALPGKKAKKCDYAVVFEARRPKFAGAHPWPICHTWGPPPGPENPWSLHK